MKSGLFQIRGHRLLVQWLRLASAFAMAFIPAGALVKQGERVAPSTSKALAACVMRIVAVLIALVVEVASLLERMQRGLARWPEHL